MRGVNSRLTLASLLARYRQARDIAPNRAITVGNLANRIPICVPIEPRRRVAVRA